MARTSGPRISIGLPVFNGEPFLPEALDSILNQTFSDFELIIADNASTDKTEEICRAYATRDNRVRYFRNETNLGAAKNFNRVFALSSGEYFKWAAADDILEPEFLARCVDVLDDDPHVVLAYPIVRFMSEPEEGPERTDVTYSLPRLQSPSVRERMHEMFFNAPPSMYVHGLIFGLLRSAVLRDTPLIRNCLGSDVCLLIDLGLRGKLVQVPACLLHIRIHRDSYTYNLRQEKRATGQEGAKQIRWFDPTTKGKVVLPAWRLFWEHFLSIARCSETRTDKLFIAALLCRAMNWERKQLGEELRLAVTETLKRSPFGLVAKPLGFGIESAFTFMMVLMEGIFQILRRLSKFSPRRPT